MQNRAHFFLPPYVHSMQSNIAFFKWCEEGGELSHTSIDSTRLTKVGKSSPNNDANCYSFLWYICRLSRYLSTSHQLKRFHFQLIKCMYQWELHYPILISIYSISIYLYKTEYTWTMFVWRIIRRWRCFTHINMAYILNVFGPTLNSNFCLFHWTQSNFEANLETKHAEQSNWLLFRSQAREYVCM